MSLICVMRCGAGVLVLADNQESGRRQRWHVEKIDYHTDLAPGDVSHTPDRHVVFAATGNNADFIDSLSEAIRQWTTQLTNRNPTVMEGQLHDLVAAHYLTPLGLSMGPIQRLIHAFVCISPSSSKRTELYEIKCESVERVASDHFAVLAGSDYRNMAPVLKAVYQKDMSRSHLIVLGVYLLLKVKERSRHVGFNTSVFHAHPYGFARERPELIDVLERSVRQLSDEGVPIDVILEAANLYVDDAVARAASGDKWAIVKVIRKNLKLSNAREFRLAVSLERIKFRAKRQASIKRGVK